MRRFKREKEFFKILKGLKQTASASPKTIYTMLSRLEKKGVIVHEKESRVFVYTPCVKKDDYLADPDYRREDGR